MGSLSAYNLIFKCIGYMLLGYDVIKSHWSPFAVKSLIHQIASFRQVYREIYKKKFRHIDVQAYCGTQNNPLNAARSPA